MKRILIIILLILVLVGLGVLFTKTGWKMSYVADFSQSKDENPKDAKQENTNNTGYSEEVVLKDYSEMNNLFTLSYNSKFKVEKQIDTPTLDWKVDGLSNGTVLATIIIPKEFVPNTNFSDAKLTIARGNDTEAVKRCLTINDSDPKTASVKIAGKTFRKFLYQDAGAGNYYDTTSYRAVMDKYCYAIEYTIHYMNIDNYSEDSGVKEFDKKFIEGEIEKILQTLKFNLK